MVDGAIAGMCRKLVKETNKKSATLKKKIPTANAQKTLFYIFYQFIANIKSTRLKKILTLLLEKTTI